MERTRVIISVCLLGCLVVALASVKLSDAAPITSYCIDKKLKMGCPAYKGTPGQKCGFISICTTTGKPQSNLAMVCSFCGPVPPNASALRKCNFQTGICQVNNGEGGPCNPKGPPAAGCKAFGTTCLPVIGEKRAGAAKFRCCRTKCPPGLCGAGSQTTFWTNECNQKILCPGTCPKTRKLM